MYSQAYYDIVRQKGRYTGHGEPKSDPIVPNAMKEATKIMGSGMRFFGLSDLHKLIEKYFVILYPGYWSTYDKKIQRVIKEELRDGIDYTWDGKNRVMSEAQALRFVTQNASIRRYFLRVMAEKPEELEKHFADLDIQLIEQHNEQHGEQNEEDSSGTGAASFTDEYILSGRIVDDFTKRILLDMLADTSADTLYDYFGIDREAFTKAYMEYMGLNEVMDFCGMSELRYKLARPSIYYPIDKDSETVGGNKNMDNIKGSGRESV